VTPRGTEFAVVNRPLLGRRRERYRGRGSLTEQEDTEMAGKRIVVIERRTFTFASLQGSQSQSLVFERALDASGYREASAEVVVHSQTYASPIGL